VAIDYELGQPKITKDGVTVAKHIEFRDTLQDLGGKLIKFSADESNKFAGDGTTTATMLASFILEEGVKACRKGYNPIDLKQGIEIAGRIVEDYLIERSLPITS